MNAKCMFKMGFLSMFAATGLFGAAEGFAADALRVDVIGTIDETVAQLDSQPKSTEANVQRVDVIDSIGSGGPLYAYPKSMRVDVIDSIQDRGSQYAHTKSLSH